MPEGDTVHRYARALALRLNNRVIDELALHDLGAVSELAGCRVTDVQAMGKQLLIHTDAGWTLRVHHGMHGTWRIQHAVQPRPRTATVALIAGDVVCLCLRAYRAELIRSHQLRAHPRLARLGPDLLEDPPRLDAIVERAMLPAHSLREIADVLLDQRVAAGIGNVYKSEALFQRRIHPRLPAGRLDRAAWHALYQEAARLLRLNLATRRRTSVPLARRPQPGSARLWVYERAGQPCLVCGTGIVRFVQGDMARSTYYCPGCQPEGSSGSPA